MANPERILITRLSAIGDCILTMPVACALRDRFPDAEITWIAEAAGGMLLDGHPALDRLIIVRKHWLKSWSEMTRVRSELRPLGIDTVIDVQSLTKSAVAGWLSRAPRRIGFSAPLGREAAPWLNNVLVPRTVEHVVSSYLQLLQPLGIDDPEIRFDIPERPAAAALVDRWITQQTLPTRFALINPGAGWDSKIWPAERYAVVAAELGEQHDLPSVVLWAGDRERQWAEEVVAGARGYAILAPQTNLSELAALVRRTRLFIGSDTGPMHLAAAVGTSCVALFGPTRATECGPYGSGHIALQKQIIEGSSHDRRTADDSAIRAITVDDVVAACAFLLENGTVGEFRPANAKPPKSACATRVSDRTSCSASRFRR